MELLSWSYNDWYWRKYFWASLKCFWFFHTSLSLSHTHTHTQTHTHISLSLSLSLCLCLSLSHTYTHTHTYTLCYTHTRSLSLSLFAYEDKKTLLFPLVQSNRWGTVLLRPQTTYPSKFGKRSRLVNISLNCTTPPQLWTNAKSVANSWVMKWSRCHHKAAIIAKKMKKSYIFYIFGGNNLNLKCDGVSK